MSGLRGYRSVVVWGLRKSSHTHRYIHRHFAATLRKLAIRHCWVDDLPHSAAAVQPGDLVIAANVAGRHLPIVEGADYCLHNFDELANLHDRLDPRRNIRLQVYTDRARRAAQQWDAVTYFDPPSRTLYQPWGTDLLAHEFRPPIVGRLPAVLWVGSVWNNALDQGNAREIGELRRVLRARRLRFFQIQGVPDRVNALAVRLSRLAPAVAGRWQVENNYLPCRMFKNVSYGQLGLSNVPLFRTLFGDSAVAAASIEELVDAGLSLGGRRYREITAQQQAVVRNHTYERKLEHIVRALALLK